MFGGTPERNLANRIEKNLPTEWSIDPNSRKNIKWVAQLGSRTLGTPVIAGGRVFIGTNNMNPRDPKWSFKDKQTGRPIDLGVLMCFRETDGAFLWQAVHEKLPGGQVVDWPGEGLGSIPTVDGDRLYYVSNRCELICAEVQTGKAIWSLDMIGKLGVFPHNRSICSPLVVGDAVFVITSNGVNEDHISIPAPKAPSFIAVSKKDGAVLWQDNSPTVRFNPPSGGAVEYFKYLANRGDIIMHGQWSSPAYGSADGVPQVIFPGGDGWLYSFEPATGKLHWRFDCNPKDAVFGFWGTRNHFLAMPVIHKNRVYIGVGEDIEHGNGVANLWCIDMTRRGDVSAELRLANGGIAKNPNSAAVWYYGGRNLPPEEQRKLRRNYLFDRTLSTCAIHDDLVYAADLGGILHCLDADTGKVQWERNLKATIVGSPFYADGKVYLGSDEGTVHVFQHGRTMKVLAENEMDDRIRSPVVTNNGVLYVTTPTRLYAIAQER